MLYSTSEADAVQNPKIFSLQLYMTNPYILKSFFCLEMTELIVTYQYSYQITFCRSTNHTVLAPNNYIKTFICIIVHEGGLYQW